MTSKLVQKHPIKGTREFLLAEDEVQYSIKSPFKTDSLSVLFDVLDPEPVISGSTLSFISQVNKEPLVELLLNKPDKEAFDEFVESLRQKIIENDFGRFRVGDKGIDVDIARLDESIEMLQTNVDATLEPSEIKLFLSALVELKTKPDDLKCQKNVADTFNDLGFAQSQVIIYAPYINFMFSGNRWHDDS
jgi:hypothetical protein